MFSGCTSLTTAPALPATTLDNNSYSSMFSGCTSLTTAPELPATTLAGNCYQRMFYGCTSLTKAPELPATMLAEYCYEAMFNRCTSLTKAPSVLPATTLAVNCYQFMFEFTVINAIPRIMATTYATDSCKGMFDDIKTLNVYSASGTGHTYGWTAPSSASTYCSGMFGSDDGESEWTKLDGLNFPNSGTPTDGTTYYFKKVIVGAVEDVTPEVTTQTPLVTQILEGLVGKAQGANATADKILEGYSAYVGQELVEGTAKEGVPLPSGLTKYAIDKFTFTTSTKLNYLLSHSLKEKPKVALLLISPSEISNISTGCCTGGCIISNEFADGDISMFARKTNAYASGYVSIDANSVQFNSDNSSFYYQKGIEYTLITMA